IVVDVRHVGDIDDGVVHVDARKVLAAHVVARPVDTAGAKGEPADGTPAPDRNRNAEVAAAHERDERGRVHGLHGARTWNPAPPALYECPAPVVEWREAPCRIIDPCPAPRIDPRPVA